MKKRVGIWIRVSTEDQKRGDSPEHHLERAKAYATLHDFEVIEVYDLTGVSGKTVMRHVEAQRMLMDIKRGHITGLIFSKLARLARNTRELLDVADYFREHDSSLVSIQESFDTSTPSGKLFFTFIAAIAEWEREEIVDRVNSSLDTRAKLGKLTGNPPYGYRRKGKDGIELHPEESVIRRKMFELYLTHKRYGTVARILNEEGYRTKRGKKFSDTAIKRLLKDPIAMGLRRAHFTQKDKNGRTELRNRDEWYLHEAPAIVSKALWEEVNDMITEHETTNKYPKNRKLKLFTGLLFCQCGGKMYMPSNNPKYICRKCRHKIPAEDMEAIFKSQLKKFLFSEKEMKQYYEKSREEVTNKERELEVVIEKIEKVRKKIEKLLELHEAGQIQTERFSEFYNEPNEQLEQLKRTKTSLESEIKIVSEHSKSSEHIIEEAHSLYDNWDDLSNEEKRTIVDIIISKVVIGQQDVSITLRALTPPKKDTNFLELATNGQRHHW